MKKLLALLLSALLSLTAVGALAEEAPLEFSYMTISSDTWNSEQLPMVSAKRAPTRKSISLQLRWMAMPPICQTCWPRAISRM